MTERPILFSSSMVRAILSGAKTQTRRIMRPQPPPVVGTLPQSLALVSDEAGDHLCAVSRRAGHGGWFSRCPYGQEGDRLWVRETWRVSAWDEDEGKIAVDYRADNHSREEWIDPSPDDDGEMFNRLWQESCDDCERQGIKLGDDERYHWERGNSPCRWRPSIFMPRSVSRITLDLTGVLVERLNDISRGDAMAEGCPFPNMAAGPDPRQWYADLWDRINAKRAPWASNPWVWVIKFKKT